MTSLIPPLPRPLLGLLLGLLACLCFVMMNVLIKQLGSEHGVSVYEMVFWRSGVTLLYLLLQAWLLRWPLRSRYIPSHLLRGAAGGLSMLCMFYGFAHLPLATAQSLTGTTVLFFALLSLFGAEKPGAQVWLAALLGFAGVLLLAKPGGGGGASWFALAVGLLSALFAAIAQLKVRELGLLGEPSWRIVFYFSLVATLIGAALGIIKGWHVPTPATLGLLIALGALGTLGQLCMTKAFALGDKFAVSMLAYLTLALTAVAGFVFFGERLDAWAWLGVACIVATGPVVRAKRLP